MDLRANTDRVLGRRKLLTSIPHRIRLVPQSEADTLAAKVANQRRWMRERAEENRAADIAAERWQRSRQFWSAVTGKFERDEDCMFLRRQALAD